MVATAGTRLDPVMVAYASQADRFAPVDLPRVSVSGDGSLAAVHEVSRITLLELPAGDPFAEIGADPDAVASEVAWVGAPPRLLVLSRYDAHSTAHLIDPSGPSTIAEIRLEATMRLVATVGGWALVVGSLGAAVLTAGDTYLSAYQFPARVVPVTAGPAANLFVVALASSLEEWDPQSRAPRRRMRLPRIAAITAVGGSERLVWMTTQQEPARIDVIPLVNRGQPRAHELPEPILRATGHPRSDLVACIGAESGRLYIVDLDGRTRLRVIDSEGIDRVDAASLVIGRMTGVLVAQAGRPIAVVRLDGREELDPTGTMPASAIALRRGLGSRPIAIDERDVVDHGRPDPLEIHASLHDEAAAPASPTDLATPMFSLRPPSHDESSLDEPSQHEPSDDELSDGELSDDELSDDELPDDELSDDEMADDDTSHDEIPHDVLPIAQEASAFVAPASDETAEDEPAQRSQPAIRLDASAQRSPPPAQPISPISPIAPQPRTSSVVRAAAAPAARAVPTVADRVSAWRDMVRHRQGPVEPVAATRPAAHAPRDEAPRSWRDELVTWSRALAAGADDGIVRMPDAPAIDALAARFELAPRLAAVIARLYGAHLCGEAGVAPVDVACLLDRQWDEALGRGELARAGVCEYVRSRVALSPVILRALDELPPLTGALIGIPGAIALLGPCVVVAGGEPLLAVAERYLPRVGGAILVAHPDVPCAPLAFEARVHGAAAMLRTDGADPAGANDPVIFVVDDDDLADELGVPYLS
ncbi:MAG TPA: hypothetical protein VGD80_13120 [Kofleriaceae bacterium]